MVSSAAWSAPDRSSTVRTGCRGRQDQVAGRQAGARGRAVLGYPADEQALGVEQADGAPQPPGHMAGSDRDTELRRPDGFAAGERIDPAAQLLVGGYGQVETLASNLQVTTN